MELKSLFQYILLSLAYLHKARGDTFNSELAVNNNYILVSNNNGDQKEGEDKNLLSVFVCVYFNTRIRCSPFDVH